MQDNRITTFVLGALLLALSAAAGALPSGKPTAQRAADMAAVKNFKLTSGFLKKWEAYSEDAVRKPCQLSPMIVLGKSGNKYKTLAQAVSAFDAQPGVHAALARHDLSAREVVLGSVTLMSAAMSAVMQDLNAKHPKMAGGNSDAPKVSAANMAFYRKHAKQLRQHQLRIGREQLKRNGGKLPPCLHVGQ